jgi:hypothetical protein
LDNPPSRVDRYFMSCAAILSEYVSEKDFEL